MKHTIVTVLIVFGLLSVVELANAAGSAVPEPFQGFDENSLNRDLNLQHPQQPDKAPPCQSGSRGRRRDQSHPDHRDGGREF